jgi:hypothetical protein
MSGYVECGCRDCFERAIGEPGSFCWDCLEAECPENGECLRDNAYGGFCAPGTCWDCACENCKVNEDENER